MTPCLSEHAWNPHFTPGGTRFMDLQKTRVHRLFLVKRVLAKQRSNCKWFGNLNAITKQVEARTETKSLLLSSSTMTSIRSLTGSSAAAEETARSRSHSDTGNYGIIWTQSSPLQSPSSSQQLFIVQKQNQSVMARVMRGVGHTLVTSLCLLHFMINRQLKLFLLAGENFAGGLVTDPFLVVGRPFWDWQRPLFL